jgi:hypothetical protein
MAYSDVIAGTQSWSRLPSDNGLNVYSGEWLKIQQLRKTEHYRPAAIAGVIFNVW